MGDRANVVIIADDEEIEANRAVFLYGHWSGSELPEDLKRALDRKERWDDPQYLSRIIFEEMIPASQRGAETGFGITTTMGDNEYPLLVVDCPRQVIVELPEDAYKARGLKAVREFTGVPFAKYKGKWKKREAEVEA